MSNNSNYTSFWTSKWKYNQNTQTKPQSQTLVEQRPIKDSNINMSL